ncbi:hypothetical protein BMAFMH_E0782, partial [Burkholderia mallei FMH]
ARSDCTFFCIAAPSASIASNALSSANAKRCGASAAARGASPAARFTPSPCAAFAPSSDTWRCTSASCMPVTRGVWLAASRLCSRSSPETVRRSVARVCASGFGRASSTRCAPEPATASRRAATRSPTTAASAASARASARPSSRTALSPCSDLPASTSRDSSAWLMLMPLLCTPIDIRTSWTS